MLLKDVFTEGNLIACFDLRDDDSLRDALISVRKKYPDITLVTFAPEDYHLAKYNGSDVIYMAYSELIAFDSVEITGVLCGSKRNLDRFGKGVMRI